jgi:histone deacetylase 6
MKRVHDLQGSPPLKRRVSSLFSIATIREDELFSHADLSVNESTTAKNASQSFLTREAKAELPNAVYSPSLSVSEASTDDDGLFFDDDNELSATTGSDATNSNPQSFSPRQEIGISIRRFSAQAEVVKAETAAGHDCKTGIVTEVGLLHFDRRNRYHKERPIRIQCLVEALQTSKDELYQRCCVLNDERSEAARSFLEDEDFLRVHRAGYIQRLAKLSACTCCETIDREAEQYKSIYLTADSLLEAQQAATSLCTLVSGVVQGDLDNGFAIIRPPGHHAEPGLASGYCVINNVAVATAYARSKLNVKKILIVDWDVHHGNGTQAIFLNDPNVLYFSVHRWHGGNYFPFLPNAGPATVGTGKGEGFTVNVGWTRKNMGNDEYYAVWERLLMPMAHEFDPELVLISAGFDAADGDLGECRVTPEGFGGLTRALTTLANGRVVGALEGGYVRSVLGPCVSAVISSLLDRRSPEQYRTQAAYEQKERAGVDLEQRIDPVAAQNIRATVAAHQPYWKFLQK